MTNTNNFIQWLDALLIERKQLRGLLNDWLVNGRHGANVHKVPALEQQIAELILQPLSLSKREAPGKPSLVSVAAYVLHNCAGMDDEPELIWQSWVHNNIKTDGWPGSLKERLTLLCAPLDKALAERLSVFVSRANLGHKPSPH